jgi:hypothetical protein
MKIPKLRQTESLNHDAPMHSPLVVGGWLVDNPDVFFGKRGSVLSTGIRAEPDR